MSDKASLKSKNDKVRIIYSSKDKKKAQNHFLSSHRCIHNKKDNHRDNEYNLWNIHTKKQEKGNSHGNRTTTSGRAPGCYSSLDIPSCSDCNGRQQHSESVMHYSLQKKLHNNGDLNSRNYGSIKGKNQINTEKIRRQRAEETRVYGVNSCQALFRNRPDSIVRAWFEKSITLKFRDALRWMASERKAYHVVEYDELAKASGTEHHGGVCFLIKKRSSLNAVDYLGSVSKKQDDCVLALKKINNPHNLGAILRSCAHFGINAVMMDDSTLLESGAAVRTAEGGAEHIKAIQCNDMLQDIHHFHCAGYTVITLHCKSGTSLSEIKIPNRAVFVLGEELNDLSSEALCSQADIVVAINGTGRIPHLNVSVSTGILLAEWWRQNRCLIPGKIKKT
ncbi:MAG: tRNA/rRNA methyltransferase [Sodalis sp. (in: enterobacteria)]